MSNTPPMSHKRKRSYEGLLKVPISNSHPTKIPAVDLNTLIQDSDSSNPSTSFNTLPILISESPPSSESSQASYQRFPLTKRNLHQLNRINKTMASASNTPNKATASTPNTPENKSQRTKTTATTSENARSVRDALEKNNYYIQDIDAARRGKDLIDKAKAIVKGERESALKEEQGQALLETARKHERDNELTFLVHVWGEFLSVKHTRLVALTADGGLENEKEAIKWIETAWEKDHLKCNWSANFPQDAVPQLINLDRYQIIFLDQVPRVKTPRPDLAYGLLHNTLSVEEQRVNAHFEANLSPYMDHPFFIVEAKNAEGIMYEAENQCARGGAAMVRLKRKFDKLADGTYVEEPKKGKGKDGDCLANTTSQKDQMLIDHYRTDAKSFAFSLAFSPMEANLFVHWAEEALSKEGALITVNWHASQIAHYYLKLDGAPWVELHHDIDNVLDWGVLTRRQELKELCSQIYIHESSNKIQRTS